MNKDLASRQLSLLFGHTPASLQNHLERHLGKTVSLILTRNSTSMLSFRIRGGVQHVRLHQMFLSAGREVLNEIVSFLKGKKGAMPEFRRFIRGNRESLGVKPLNKIRIKTSGRFHDLQELYDEINQAYFEGKISAAITWGTGSSRFSVRKRTLGSYRERSNTIRINPVLDRKSVPRYYLSFVIYHEMLHAAMGISKKGERRSVHPREFRQREKLFRDYERAREWERGKA